MARELRGERIRRGQRVGRGENAKLKGQMLTTALNVYFSDTSLGGDGISAPWALGPYLIRLWYICDNTALGPGCGSFEDATAAFGAPHPAGPCNTWAACMSSRRTVLQILAPRVRSRTAPCASCSLVV
jgi:hypothetical protein